MAEFVGGIQAYLPRLAPRLCPNMTVTSSLGLSNNVNIDMLITTEAMPDWLLFERVCKQITCHKGSDCYSSPACSNSITDE
jgi:hypothetical protein